MRIIFVKCVYKSLKIIRVLGNMREKNIYEFKLCITILWLVFPMTKFNLLDMEILSTSVWIWWVVLLQNLMTKIGKIQRKRLFFHCHIFWMFKNNFGHPNLSIFTLVWFVFILRIFCDLIKSNTFSKFKIFPQSLLSLVTLFCILLTLQPSYYQERKLSLYTKSNIF